MVSQPRKRVVESYQPVLDIALPLVEDMVEFDRARLVVPNIPKFWGLGLDVAALIHRLYPSSILAIYNGRDCIIEPRYKETNIKTLQLDIEGANFLPQMESPTSSRFQTTLLLSDSSSEKISISARGTKGKQKENILFKTISERIQLQTQIHLISLFFGYLSDFPIRTVFQDFEPLFRYRGKEIEGDAYPASLKHEHVLREKTFRFIREPLKWNGISQRLASAITVIAGQPLEDVVERNYPNRPEEKDMIKSLMPYCYALIECLVEGLSFDVFLQTIGCKPPYTSMFLSKPLRTIKYFANPDTIKSHTVQNIVNKYNQEYAKRQGKRTLTVDELCYANRQVRLSA